MTKFSFAFEPIFEYSRKGMCTDNVINVDIIIPLGLNVYRDGKELRNNWIYLKNASFKNYKK